MTLCEADRRLLDRAARWAVRGHGLVEPNPMVGCVLTDAKGRVRAMASHRCYGGPHAEILTLQQAGDLARNGTVHVTLEPCSHHGKTPPCVEALIRSGVARVVIGARDPNPIACGGADQLRDAGIHVDFANHAPSIKLIDPFRIRLLHKRPWITVKWAQTLDGKIATRSGDSRWISSRASRQLVHRERGRVDAILTGIGTVLQDDPQLTARHVRRRRIATRIVLDRALRTPLNSALISTVEVAPLLIVTDRSRLESQEAQALRSRGAVIVGRDVVSGRFDIPSLMQELHRSHGIATMMVEAGTGLMSDMVRSGCADELAIFMAPRLMADSEGFPPLSEDVVRTIADARRVRLDHVHRRDMDVLFRCKIEN
ncbi:MAG: bifunctional diaminohydroxyphosphoribosylaminopyrimidine deaminase/5-amino-6-(5-phosphoribosylamino)uracil reductase RibD [Phycisphaerales bacterium]|nr:bifunctional diaminohydroxyphosphoribosylaminopyrimidine deaminase/5-amino-6-(5-phosphoribosylamino)uracil reductase RibD [Phycisphaerales bacterium]